MAREQPRPTESSEEIKVYEAFASGLLSNWTMWHSLSVWTDKRMEGEGDFIVDIPDRCFLVFEVKGGLIEQRDVRWYQNSKPMDRAPRDQAHLFAKKLLSRLHSVHGREVPYSILRGSPYAQYSEAPEQDNLLLKTR